MKSVLISIQPKWCELIASGKKTIEIRKTRPKLETPFKCYIYCTAARQRLFGIMKDGDENYGEIYHGKTLFFKGDDGSVLDMYGRRQKVISEFVCDRIEEIPCYLDAGKYEEYLVEEEFLKSCQLTYDELFNYLKGKDGYGWHISDLKIYDTPKELWEFSRFGFKRMGYSDCICANEACKYREKQNNYFDPPLCIYRENGQSNCQLNRPPQSWCYVEE